MAALHTAASFPALVDLMRAMNLINQEIFVRCTIGVVLAFAVVYFNYLYNHIAYLLQKGAAK